MEYYHKLLTLILQNVTKISDERWKQSINPLKTGESFFYPSPVSEIHTGNFL